MRQRFWLAPVIVFVIALAVYLRTAPSGLTWAHDSADGGDLIAAALVRGVPHPSGYPTFDLVARLFTRTALANPCMAGDPNIDAQRSRGRGAQQPPYST